MNRNIFKSSLEKHVQIPDSDLDYILNKATIKTYKKRQFLVFNETLSRKTHFIESGSAVAYFTDNKGEEHLIQFALEGWWISDIKSFLYGEKAILNIQAIENCVVYEFTFDDMKDIFKKVHAFQEYFLIVTQNAFANFQQRTLNNLHMSSQERYLNFCKQYPNIQQRLSQKWISSYLGFSAESLSRIKRKLHKLK